MANGTSHRSPSRYAAIKPTNRWIFLALLAGVAAFLGGASRYDAIQIVPLRALSGLLLIPALYYLAWHELKREAALVTLFGLFVMVVGLQLAPLPPEIWHALPGRDAIEQLDGALGFDDVWRPLSLAPMRTWNAFGSLVVPAAGLLLAIALRASTRDLLQIVAGLGILNAALGLLQVISGRSSPLYFYELTNWGSAVGIFANENHSAVFAACSLLVVARLGLEARIQRGARWLSIFYPASFFLIVLVALVSGSRAGFVACLGAALIAVVMIGVSPARRSENPPPGRLRRWSEQRPYLVAVVPLLILALTVVGFVALGRAPAFSDILAKDSFADLRWSILPVISEMLSTHWLVGSGFGSFEQVYHIYEPSELLMPRYVNQAHNDWLQFVIEGGVIAGALLAGLTVWMVRSLSRSFHVRMGPVFGIFWISIFSIIAAASLVDYPLRTPIFQLVLIWLLLALSRDHRDAEDT
ncbi:O-antigen ligase family protein [Qipengyuania nanhaisediminis]|uniref:O-antigen ligase n=1 Tax=Qipengyuania nanhaisediminis TaxID=604088 RepID=A0A1I5QF10_9SPHN|nr:O-antigen ligase family protein [Qipengyuania nanhaisediminis]SFP44436.1 O-antigen ligase [Qipengyuania nanhaisediminis]